MAVKFIPPLPPAEVQHGDASTLPPLYVITVISNPVRFNSRYQLYREFAHRCQTAGAILYTVELAFGQRPFAITEADNPHHVRLRTNAELWHKENLINLGIQRLPDEAQYIAWVDADIAFNNPHWVNETVQQLQHYDIVQMFNWAQDLGPDYGALPYSHHRGFVYGWQLDPSKVPKAGPGAKAGAYPYGAPIGASGSLYHPGYAWAARRSTLNSLGGLIDYGLLGQSDYHMAQALLGNVDLSLYKGINRNYVEKLHAWQRRAKDVVRLNVGYVEGSLVHYWHGRKVDRKYWPRNEILVSNDYNPNTDIMYGLNGVLQLTGNKPRLRDEVRKYFRERNEDTIDM